MTKKDKKRLQQAYNLVEKGIEIIAAVKVDRKGIKHDDDFYALEHWELSLWDINEELKDNFLS